jgi:hypothetical protein
VILIPALFAAGEAAASPVGVWCTKGQPNDLNMITYDRFDDDGTFRFEFRKYRGRDIVFQAIEEGRWVQEGDLVTTFIYKLDGRPAHYAHRYKYEHTDEAEMRLHHVDLNFTYVERRVDGLAFPACWLGS